MFTTIKHHIHNKVNNFDALFNCMQYSWRSCYFYVFYIVLLIILKNYTYVCNLFNIVSSTIHWLSPFSRSIEKILHISLPYPPINVTDHNLLRLLQHFSGARGRVTLKLMVRSGQNSISSEILWLAWLPVRLMKMQSKMKALSWPKHFLHYKSMRIVSSLKGK